MRQATALLSAQQPNQRPRPVFLAKVAAFPLFFTPYLVPFLAWSRPGAPARCMHSKRLSLRRYVSPGTSTLQASSSSRPNHHLLRPIARVPMAIKCKFGECQQPDMKARCRSSTVALSSFHQSRRRFSWVAALKDFYSVSPAKTRQMQVGQSPPPIPGFPVYFDMVVLNPINSPSFLSEPVTAPALLPIPPLLPLLLSWLIFFLFFLSSARIAFLFYTRTPAVLLQTTLPDTFFIPDATLSTIRHVYPNHREICRLRLHLPCPCSRRLRCIRSTRRLG